MSIYIIAEIGINHNGDIDIAKSLIQEAKLAGCDAVKFQKRDIGLVYKKDFLDSYRESPWGKTQRDQKQGLELTEDEYLLIDSYSKELNIDWFASAWDIKSQNFLNNFNCNKNKIASAMIIDTNLLTEVAKEGKHTYISTGMSEYEDIKRAVDIFRKEDCSFELMHCRSTYPMQDDHANLGAIKTL